MLYIFKAYLALARTRNDGMDVTLMELGVIDDSKLSVFPVV